MSAATYWQYVSDWTGREGWFRYAAGVPEPCGSKWIGGGCDLQKFKVYQRTVDDGTYWGGAITGGVGGTHRGTQQVLDHVPGADAHFFAPVILVAVTTLLAGLRLLNLTVSRTPGAKKSV